MNALLAYFLRYHGRLAAALGQHLLIVFLAMFISVLLASAITFLLQRHARSASAALRFLGAVYAIPSLALFSILIPFLGIGLWPAICVLVLYNQFLLVRNFLAGLDRVSPVLVDAARGMGMSGVQTLLTLKLPLAFPVILGGVRLAFVSTIGIATIAAAINAGGIGAVLFDGLRTMNTAKIVWGSVLAGALAITTNLLLSYLEHLAARKLHYEE